MGAASPCISCACLLPTVGDYKRRCLGNPLGPCGGASCSPTCLFPSNLTKCTFSTVYCTFSEGGSHCFLCSSFPICLCKLLLCLCLCPFGCSFCRTWWPATCFVCLWLWLLGHLNEISAWDLLCFLPSESFYCLCEFSLLCPECSLYLLVFL